MTLYPLYLESGPKRKTTMVHVPDLLGCVATGPTTDDALARTPGAIRAFLCFLHRHGVAVDPDAEIETRIAEHVTEGTWLGNGSPYIVFAWDLEPLTPDDTEAYIERLEWMRGEMLDLIEGLSDDAWEDKPDTARAVRRIVEHVSGAEYSFVRLFGKLPGVSGPGATEKMSRDELLGWTEYLQQCEFDRLRALTDAERTELVPHGQSLRTARKVMRRMLEHQWEHLVELGERFAP
ncbi:MAG TPA: type II toxin-antitoxin system HicB family antitoxin [Thermomicrobiales bacterium]|jgi:predicted RNase H-like HicB family nuclease/uncharacterized damage-inducible protein DinB